MKVHRARKLVAEDRRLLEEIPVTSPARTHLDLAERVKPRRLPQLIKRGEELRIFDLDAVVACCERSRGHRGRKPLRRALSAHRRDPRVTRSDAKRDFLDLVRSAGLPLPATNYVVGPYELDTYWPAARLAIEIDTFETHGTRVSFEGDRERDAKLAAVGITVVRGTASRLDADPDEVAAELAALLSTRGAARSQTVWAKRSKRAVARRRPASPPWSA